MQVNFHVVLLVCSCFLGKKAFSPAFLTRGKKNEVSKHGCCYGCWGPCWRNALQTQKKGKCWKHRKKGSAHSGSSAKHGWVLVEVLEGFSSNDNKRVCVWLEMLEKRSKRDVFFSTFFNDEPNAYVFATFRGTNAYVCGVCVECVCGLCLVEILKQANAYVFGL